MSASSSLRDLIESCELPHAAFVQHEQALMRRLQDAVAGRPPVSEWIVGPSRVGKSMLIARLLRQFPGERVGGVRHVPVLKVDIPSPATPKELPRSLLSALGYTDAKGSSNALLTRVERLLTTTKTKAVLFEEASHIVDVGNKMPPRAAGDWFKGLMDNLGLSIILFGIPRLEKLYASNEQLRKRSQARRVFRPYDYTDVVERQAFAACVRTYAELFKSRGYTFDIPFELLVQHCYLFSGGLIGVVGTFMNRLAYDIEPGGRRVISFTDCRMSLALLEASGSPAHPAFVRDAVSPVELNQAYAHVMKEAELPLRHPQ